MKCTKQVFQSLSVIVFASSLLNAADFYVSPTGSDDNPGTMGKPFKTLARVCIELKPGDTCFLREGTYLETLAPLKSGTEGAPILFRSYKGELAVISGVEAVNGWKDEGKGVYSAAMTWSLDDRNQFFADGQMLHEATWPALGDKPLFHPIRAIVKAGSENTLLCDEIPGTAEDWKGAELWCAGGASWICWTANVESYDSAAHKLTFSPKQSRHWYVPRKGNAFVLRGARYALQKPGQWHFDAGAKRLFVIPPAGTSMEKLTVTAKRRNYAIDLSGRSYIHVKDIEFVAAGLRSDDKSSHLVLDGLKGSYVEHCYVKDRSKQYGVMLRGNNNLLVNSELSYSSSSVLVTGGFDNRVINCFIHHGGYAGLWNGTVKLTGRRVVFSHNTVCHAGRDLINTHGLMESLVQYNDVSDAGWLTDDLGMFYGHNTDFANTQFCYNYVHDNRAHRFAPAIYFDHLSNNALIHHNLIRDCRSDPVRINNPSYGMMVFNNSAWHSGAIGTFDHSKREDLSFCRYLDNIFNAPFRLPPNATVRSNVINSAPPYLDAVAGDLRLKEPLGKNAGAIAPGGRLFQTGWDFKNPPNPLPVYKPADFPFVNKIRNSCFEFGSLESWERTGEANATVVKGNGWGNDFARGTAHPTGTMRHELKLGAGKNGVVQEITGLSPGGTYILSAWVRVDGVNETVMLGVKDYGGKEITVESAANGWTRKDITFTMGPATKEAIVYLEKTTAGNGNAWGDNFIVQLQK
jgi:hypothetical protein